MPYDTREHVVAVDRMIYAMSLNPSVIIETDRQANSHVTDDLACAECGYNLRTLAHDADCPECGMSILVSMRGDRLSAAPLDWLKTLFHGARWLRLSVILAFPIIYLGVAISSYSIWVLTIAQPDRTEPSLDRSYRLAARWATAIGSLIVVAATFGALIYVAATEQRFAGNWNMRMNSGPGGMSIGELPMFDTVFLIGHAVYVLGLLSTWRYLRVLAQRIPDEGLATAWRSLGRYWLGSVLGLTVVCGLTNVLVRTGIIPGGSASFWLPLILVLLFAVVLVLLWLATLRVSRRQALVLNAELIKAG